MSSTPLTEVRQRRSKILIHLQTYPVIHGALNLFERNSHGAIFLSVTRSTYRHFIAPLHPYLQKPYSYVLPYLSRADELGEYALSKLDNTFPIVKRDASEVIEIAKSFLLALVEESSNYVLRTWHNEYKMAQGDEGLLKSAKALLSTERKISLAGFKFIVSYLRKGTTQKNNKIDKSTQ